MRSEDGKLTTEQCKDAGLALVLICLIGYQFRPSSALMLFVILFLVTAMTCPSVFRPFARFWFALSTLLGTFVSRILLTVLFFLLVLPVGMARRALGKDAMRIKSWKKGNRSVFRVREHRFTGDDLENPY